MKILKTNMLMLALLLSCGSFYVSPVVCAGNGPEFSEKPIDMPEEGEKKVASDSRLSRAANSVVNGLDRLMIDRMPNRISETYARHLNGADASSVWVKGKKAENAVLPKSLAEGETAYIGNTQYTVVNGNDVEGREVSYLYDNKTKAYFEYKSVEVSEATARPKIARGVTVTAGAAILGVAIKTIKAIGGKLFSSKEEVVDTDNDEEEDTDVVSTENDKAKADADAEQARVEAAAKAKRAQEELAKREAQARVEAESKAINGSFAKCTPAQQAQVKRQLSIIERHAQRNGLKVTATLDTIAAAMYGKVNPNAQQRRARR